MKWDGEVKVKSCDDIQRSKRYWNVQKVECSLVLRHSNGIETYDIGKYKLEVK
jgi:hypothetical protein